ncbi:ABC transporter ATP-binding protein [Cohnella yongneupensis]|uniref:ABC transporter ATP-binding protein n=1 Tax=Cohnella yongneupensis TaxID=425006 RepID=A0ABW0QW60_9BACL
MLSEEDAEVYAVEMKGIAKRFGSVMATDGVDFAVRQGEIHALLGENGAGKSTLMSVLFGLYKPDAGEVLIHGKPVKLRSPHDAGVAGIGMVHQSFRLVQSLTAMENIVLGESAGLWRGSKWRKRKQAEIEALAERFGLRFPVDRPIWQLSVGEQQRVEIVKTLYRHSDIIVLDEPTAVLTPNEADDLYETLRQLRASGKTVIVTTHKLKEVMAACDTISIMRKGKMIASMKREATNEKELARLLMGREPLASVPVERSAPGKRLLRVERVEAKGDHGELALNSIDLEVCRGEIVGVAGVAGNGQKELAEVITGMRPALRGSLIFNEETVRRPTIRDMIRRGIAHVPENRMRIGMAGSLNVTDNLLMKSYGSPERRKFGFLRRQANRDWAERLVEAFNVDMPSVDASVRQLSGGNQQKLLLAREIDSSPDLLLAVHPTQGLDVGASEVVHQLLMGLRNRGGAVLLISEDLDEVLKLSDRVLVLYNGAINGEFIPQHARKEQIGLCMTGMNESREAAV